VTQSSGVGKGEGLRPLYPSAAAHSRTGDGRDCHNAVRDGGALLVHVQSGPASAGLEYLEGFRAEDCEGLQVLIGRGDVTVTMPNA
jgi:hypothetical protein